MANNDFLYMGSSGVENFNKEICYHPICFLTKFVKYEFLSERCDLKKNFLKQLGQCLVYNGISDNFSTGQSKEEKAVPGTELNMNVNYWALEIWK